MFCALVDHYEPGKLGVDFKSLDPNNGIENIKLAFKVFEELGIPQYLDAEDAGKETLSMMTCLSGIYKVTCY